MKRWPYRLNAMLIGGVLSASALAQPTFIPFESGPVRPLAISPSGATLFAANIADNRLEIIDLEKELPVNTGAVSVGLEPVAVAVLDSHTVFVANHLSDSISVVSLQPLPHVSRTLLVGDEPRDIVITDPDGAGPLAPRLFVTTARRGQHRNHESLSNVEGSGSDKALEPSTPRADVWVFDTANLGDPLGGTPLKIIELFSDTPRALAVSPDGQTVYAAAHFSGNGTATVGGGSVCDGFSSAGQCSQDGISTPGGIPDGLVPGGNPGPSTNFQGVEAPEVGLIVQWDPIEEQFQDELGRNWNNGIRFRLPDYDVFAIDANSLQQKASHKGVGTTLFNMATNPISGALYVSNTEAKNLTRFEGPGSFANSTVQGNLAQSRITVIANPENSSTQSESRHLNKHIDYSQLKASEDVMNASVSTPLEMVVDSEGEHLYLAAYGSGAIAKYTTSEIENDSFTPTSDNLITLSGGGPAGLVFSADETKLYVLTRFDNGLSVVDLSSAAETAHITLFNPEPESIKKGRPFLYDAKLSSSNGEASCASCHIFGDTDHLAWDLGDPDASIKSDPIPTLLGFAAPSNSNGGAGIEEFHPMKGPMVTQTLRGLSNSGAMHWRGDRSNGEYGIDATDEDLSFRNFVEAFPGLLGREEEITDEDMQAFTDFQLQVFLPPNPIRALDNSYTLSEQRGFDFFHSSRLSDGIPAITTGPLTGRTGFTCNGCHEHDASQGFFGTGTNQSFEGSTQILKVPHFRNLYTRVGMFGMPRLPGFEPDFAEFQGDQVRGFGFIHDGSVDTLKSFFSLSLFQQGGLSSEVGFSNENQHRDMAELMLAFDTDLAPVVGQQLTYSARNSDAVNSRLDLLMTRAETPFISKSLGGSTVEADLVAKGSVNGLPRSWIYEGADRFMSDQNEIYSSTELKCLAYTDAPVTFTAVPPGSGRRIGIDRDLDDISDGLENDFSQRVRSSAVPEDVDVSELTYIECLELKDVRDNNTANYNCGSQQLSFLTTAAGEQYRVRMAISQSSPLQFSLQDAFIDSTPADNVAEYSSEGVLQIPVTQVSCGSAISNIQFKIVSESPVVFEFESMGF